MSKQVIPLADRVLILPDEAPEKSKGGIIIPDVAKDPPAEGRVVAIGPGIKMKEGGRSQMPDVRPGDKVLYSKYAGTDIKVNGVAHKIMREDDISAVIVEQDATGVAAKDVTDRFKSQEASPS